MIFVTKLAVFSYFVTNDIVQSSAYQWYHVSLQATILHLKERIECLEFKEMQLSESKSREEQLSQQIKLLSEQLMKAEAHHTPVSKI